MEWFDAKTNPPKPYQEIIICSDNRNVKPAIYLGNGKYNTFVNVVYWQPFPNPPEILNEVNETHVETAKKKRGRPKKT